MIKRFLLSTVLVFSPLLIGGQESLSLSQFDYGSASVLPYYTTWAGLGSTYVILTREAYGKDKGTYDDFGGARDRDEYNKGGMLIKKGETHPLLTASREFWEEAILGETIHLGLSQVRDYIDISRCHNTQYIIANTTVRGTKNVTYITKFNKYKNKFIDRFYDALEQAKMLDQKELTEKDRIALVKWDDLKDVIANNPNNNKGLMVTASVINPRTRKKGAETQIPLRPYLVVKLRGFFSDAAYTKGRHHKIRFYS